MNYLTISIAVISLMIGTSCASDNATTESSPKNETEATVDQTSPAQETIIAKDVSADEFSELMASKPGVIIDVRTADEYAQGHLKNAVNIDFYSPDFSDKLDELDPQTPVYVYCQAGGRSGKTKNQLKEKGFSEVYNLLGGYGNWPHK